MKVQIETLTHLGMGRGHTINRGRFDPNAAVRYLDRFAGQDAGIKLAIIAAPHAEVG